MRNQKIKNKNTTPDKEPRYLFTFGDLIGFAMFLLALLSFIKML